jgi:hypothetical protein
VGLTLTSATKAGAAKWLRSHWPIAASSPRQRSKQLIAHSNHVGLQFFALMWQNLPMEDWADDDNSSSDDITFWGKKRRTQEQADELSATANP